MHKIRFHTLTTLVDGSEVFLLHLSTSTKRLTTSTMHISNSKGGKAQNRVKQSKEKLFTKNYAKSLFSFNVHKVGEIFSIFPTVKQLFAHSKHRNENVFQTFFTDIICTASFLDFNKVNTFSAHTFRWRMVKCDAYEAKRRTICEALNKHLENNSKRKSQCMKFFEQTSLLPLKVLVFCYLEQTCQSRIYCNKLKLLKFSYAYQSTVLLLLLLVLRLFFFE